MQQLNRLANCPRVASVDALRGLVIFVMIFVNDLAIIHEPIIPNWLLHFSDRSSGSGMTFVDLVFPAFIFIVGMSIPFSVLARVRKNQSSRQIVSHIIIRTVSLLVLGMLQVYGWPSTEKMGWSAPLWQTCMGICTILAFMSLGFKDKVYQRLNAWLRVTGVLGLAVLAYLFVGKQGQHILMLAPFSIYPSWWGILGLLGWAYLVASIVYLIIGNQQTVLLGCVAFLICVFAASKAGVFNGLWLAKHVNIGAALGSQAAIAVAGVWLSTFLIKKKSNREIIFFTFLYVLALSISAILLQEVYGISKNHATPAWALWSCAIISSIWLVLHLWDKAGLGKAIFNFLKMSGSNVFLTYVFAEIYFSLIINLGLGDWYRHFGGIDLSHALLRALLVSISLIICTVTFNKLGVKLKL